MSKLEVIEYELPSFWASALINGDFSGLDVEDLKALESFTLDVVEEYGHANFVDCSDDCSDFRRYHDASAYGVLACDVLTYTLLARVNE